VFAARFLPKGSYVTAYPGRVMPDANRRSTTTRSTTSSRSACASSTLSKQNDPKNIDGNYIYEFEDGTQIDGRIIVPHDRWWRTHGVAHLLNDAIHPDVTGLENNCEFQEIKDSPVRLREFSPLCVERGRSRQHYGVVGDGRRTRHRHRHRVYIRTSKNVHVGEELLVPYSLGYWLSSIEWAGGTDALFGCGRNGSSSRSDPKAARWSEAENRAANWLSCHLSVQRMLNDGLGLGYATLCEFYGFWTHDDDEIGNETATSRYLVQQEPVSKNEEDGCICEPRLAHSTFLRVWDVHLTKAKEDAGISFSASVACHKCGMAVRGRCAGSSLLS